MPKSIRIQTPEVLTADLRDTVLQLERTCFPEDPWSPAMFVVNEMEGMLLAESDDQLVGYLCFQQILDECHILNVAVHPDFRRRGIARQLVVRLMKQYPDVRDWFLEVRFSNVPARSLYEGMGFQVIGKRVRYYRDGEDALVMQRRERLPNE